MASQATVSMTIAQVLLVLCEFVHNRIPNYPVMDTMSPCSVGLNYREATETTVAKFVSMRFDLILIFSASDYIHSTSSLIV